MNGIWLDYADTTYIIGTVADGIFNESRRPIMTTLANILSAAPVVVLVIGVAYVVWVIRDELSNLF